MPFQPDQMRPGQLAAVSYLARYSGHTHSLYAYQLRRWFGWCEASEHYDRARGNLDRHGVHFLTAYVAGV